MMKKSMFLLGLLIFSPWVLADNEDAGADAQVASIMAQAKATQDTNRMATVEAQTLSQKSQEGAPLQQLVTQQSTKPAVPAASLAPAAAPAANENATMNPALVKQVQDQISQMNQSNFAFQEAMNQRVLQLSQVNAALQDKIITLNAALTALAQQVQKISALAPIPAPVVASPAVVQTPAVWEKYSLYIIVFLLLLVLFLLLPKSQSSKKSVKKTVKIDPDLKDEYDFMSTEEAIPAKLDLAHAYIAMEDFPAALLVLKEIMQIGNTKQKEDARELLAKIPTVDAIL